MATVSSGIMADANIMNLKAIDPSSVRPEVPSLLVQGEAIVSAFQTVRDQVVFTNKRVFVINVQGITGKKKDFTCIPYSKITTFSLETAGIFDLDAELEIYISAVGKVKFEFTSSTDVKQICKMISTYALN